jgi:hypothetical protein
LPASISGHTRLRRLAAIAPLNSTGRGRRVEPVTVRRRRMTSFTSSSVFMPRRNAMNTRRPSSASALSSFGTKSPAAMSRITSTPLPPVAAFTPATKSCVL